MNSPDSLPAAADSHAHAFQSAFDRGQQLHRQGKLEAALVAFEQARQVRPADIDAASACATLQMQLDRPKAAFDSLLQVREFLLKDADGATNWAIVCETVGQWAEADHAYETALQLDPHHLRALNNAALLALQHHAWPKAIALIERCLAACPEESAFHVNLCDAYSAAHEAQQALEIAQQGLARFPQHPELELRVAAQLAHVGQVAAAQLALESLSDEGKQLLAHYMRGLSEAGSRVGGALERGHLDAEQLYFVMAFGALNDCDWRARDQLVQKLRSAIALAEQTEQSRDWRDVQFYALMLPLTEQEHAQAMRATYRSIHAKAHTAAKKRPAHADGRIRLGIATQSLHDPRYRSWMMQWLASIDRSRCVVSLYANTPSPLDALSAPLRSQCDSLTEIHHMSPAETAQRIRLDDLDIFLDTAFYTPWCRAELPYMGVAPINIRLQAWTRWISGKVYQYNVGDAITHPDEFDRQGWGPTLRLPSTCWLALECDLPAPGWDRRAAGLPESALVLCGFTAGSTLDADSFALWMKALHRLPDAILWLPSYHAGARANLIREAKESGIATHRLIFSQDNAHSAQDFGISSRAKQLAQLKLADMYLDPIRFSSAHNLSDSLRMGVPSLAMRGYNMASRLGASIVNAAGLSQALVNTEQEWLEAITSWAHSPSQQKQWRNHLLEHGPSSTRPSHLFDAAARVGDWQKAFETMHQRHTQGLSPTAIDLPH